MAGKANKAQFVPYKENLEMSFDAAAIASHLGGTSSRDVATGIASLVNSGMLVPGSRLPTVRALAKELGISSSTVADAWRILSAHGIIDTARRNGTTVRSSRAKLSGRFWRVPAEPGSLRLDLSTGTPDTKLLPPLGPVLHDLHTDISITSYIDRPVLPELEDHLVDRWPFEVGALTVVDGALDALDRLVGACVRFGDTVVVEDPTFPPLLDMLEIAGAQVVGVPLDDHGIDVGSFRAALALDPAACFFQPRAHNPTGVTTSGSRLSELTDAVRESNASPWIIEDDHIGGGLNSDALSFGTRLPEQTATIISFSKSHGPDLRIAAVGGAAELVARVVDRRRLGAGWTSRLIQHVLVSMLTNRETDKIVRRARTSYAARRELLRQHLSETGVEVRAGDGLNLWIPVTDEHRTTLALAVDGIGVAPGRPFCVDHSSVGHHIRVSIGEARGDLEELSRSLAAAI